MKIPVITYDEREAIIMYLTEDYTTPNQFNNKKLENKESVEQTIKMLFPHFETEIDLKKFT